MNEITDLIAELPELRQDQVKAELGHLASLATPQTMTAAEQICSAQCIDLEGLQGIQDVLLMLALDHPQTLERVAVQASLMQRTGGKNWSTFQFEDDGKPWALDDDTARAGFVADAIAILELPERRKREADWYSSIRVHPVTGEETEILQATIYVEASAKSELTFGPSDGLERQVVQRVLEVGIACNAKERIVEICARGGKKMRDEYAASFSKHFAPKSQPPIETPCRDVLLANLLSNPSFPIEPADGIAKVEVSSLDFYSAGGGFARYERRGDDETIYQFLERQFGARSPIHAAGWTIIGATIRIAQDAQDGKRAKTLTVTLRSPNTTTIPNKTEAERQFVITLLERWKLLAPPPEPFDVTEAAQLNAVDLFATLLVQRGRVAASQYSALPAYAQLFEAGLIEESGVVPSVLCDECNQPHDTAVIYEASQYGYHCPDLDFMPIARPELIAAQVNLGAAVAQLANHLNCKRRKSTPLTNDIWRIGAIDTPAGDVVLYLKPTMQDAQDVHDFGAALAGEIKSSFGIVLTANGGLHLPPYATVSLQDVLSMEAAELTVVADLMTIAGVPEIRTGGRPSDYKTPLNELIAMRENQGLALEGRNAEAKALQAEFKAQFPNTKCPSLSIIKKYVTNARSGSKLTICFGPPSIRHRPSVTK
ncbi:hypothetical protein [Ascidiaceihabitans sp.]|uniref:hypothetical protein n=1 Tax=Ascidiaceihabitans sp. TaxID=1872644 RepID=UPI003299D5CD